MPGADTVLESKRAAVGSDEAGKARTLALAADPVTLLREYLRSQPELKMNNRTSQRLVCAAT